jgi:hypothetical protein
LFASKIEPGETMKIRLRNCSNLVRTALKSIRILPTAFILVIGVAWVGQAGPAAAQDLSFGKQIYRGKINCPQCHGWAGDGRPEDPRAPKGANLRETTMDEATLKEVIKCGLIATDMPHFDRLAYTDTRCYGVTAADLGNDKPPRGTQTLILREINGLVAYMLAKVVGAGSPTREQCIDFFDEEVPRCADFPAAGG